MEGLDPLDGLGDDGLGDDGLGDDVEAARTVTLPFMNGWILQTEPEGAGAGEGVRVGRSGVQDPRVETLAADGVAGADLAVVGPGDGVAGVHRDPTRVEGEVADLYR